MDRFIYRKEIKEAFKVHPIVALLGPRQCGKTTLARQYIQDIFQTHYFDLDDPEDQLLFEEPKRIRKS